MQTCDYCHRIDLWSPLLLTPLLKLEFSLAVLNFYLRLRSQFFGKNGQVSHKNCNPMKKHAFFHCLLQCSRFDHYHKLLSLFVDCLSDILFEAGDPLSYFFLKHHFYDFTKSTVCAEIQTLREQSFTMKGLSESSPPSHDLLFFYLNAFKVDL